MDLAEEELQELNNKRDKPAIKPTKIIFFIVQVN
jgi:hypothetical protein